MDKEESAKVVMGRVEIDSSAPFRSVKEAVLLFGERVLVREVYGNKLKEMQAAASFENANSKSRFGSLTAELEETKQTLQKTREEINLMSHSTRSLKEELEETKKELKQLKTEEYQKQPVDPEIEDLKFIESNIATTKAADIRVREEEYQEKRYVKFASPPSLAQVIVSKERMIEGTFINSVKKTKKKALIPLIGWIFSVRKSGQKLNSPRSK